MIKNLKPDCTPVLFCFIFHFAFFSSLSAQFSNETNNDDIFLKLTRTQLTERKIVPNDLTGYDRFGHSVDMDGEYAIIGAYGKNHSSGAAYIFKHEASGWEQKAKLTLNQAEANDYLGYNVAISGDVALVSGRGKESVYIFEKQERGWHDTTETARLYPSKFFSYTSYFGDALDISGNYVIVGDWQSKVVYVYEKPEEGWQDTTETLILSPPVTAPGFGHAMAIDSNYAVIGAYLYSGDGPQSGGALIYKRDSTWEYQSVIRPSDGADSDIFGIAVGIDGNRIVVGAPNKRQAYVFIRDGDEWREEDILECSSVYQEDFGIGVAISGDTVIVGAYGDSEYADDAGSASVFCRDVPDWILVNRIIAGDAHEDGLFGYSVALTGDYALVGSYGDNGDSLYAGQAYIYSDYTVPASSIHDNNGNFMREFYLAQNYPNPFNPGTRIKYEIRKPVHVNLTIYSILGEKIVELVDEYQNIGSYEMEFDASDLSNGMYLIKLKAGTFTSIKKCLLIK